MSGTETFVMLPFHSNASVRAEGRWGGGGVVAIEQNGHNRSHILSPALFDLLAILILKAHQGSTLGTGPTGSFFTVNKLCSELRRRTNGTANPLDPDPPNLAKYIFRLRRILDNRDLLEHERHLGYRLSTPAEKLTLRLLDEASENDV